MIVTEEEFEEELPNVPAVVKSKRGRRSKKELMESLNLLNVENMGMNTNMKAKIVKPKKNKKTDELDKTINADKTTNDDENSRLLKLELIEMNDEKMIDDDKGKDKDKDNDNAIIEPKVFKKRGRKPKGGKIIQQTETNDEETDEKQYVILHLKCNMTDLENSNNSQENDTLAPYNTHIYNDLYKSIDETKTSSNFADDNLHDGDDDINDTPENSKDNMKEIWKKIKQLEYSFHIDNVSKKSACFWDTCDFDTPPIYIPKYFLNGTYYVYGCFCCPECAIAYLNNQQIDRSTKNERYQLMHDVYSKIYGYTKSIKEASDPRYLLDKFIGNLSIKEYRALSRTGTLYLVIDKPLTKVYPEIHEDTEDYILNNKIIPSNTSTYQIRGKNGKKKLNKSSILSENFGIN